MRLKPQIKSFFGCQTKFICSVQPKPQSCSSAPEKNANCHHTSRKRERREESESARETEISVYCTKSRPAKPAKIIQRIFCGLNAVASGSRNLFTILVCHTSYKHTHSHTHTLVLAHKLPGRQRLVWANKYSVEQQLDGAINWKLLDKIKAQIKNFSNCAAV